MRPLQARLVTLCQQVLALGVVLVVLTPASGVVSLDIVGEHPGRAPGQAAPAELVSATVPTTAVKPVVTEVPLTATDGGFAGLAGRTVAGGATAARVVSKPQAVTGFAAVGVTWQHGEDLDEDQISLRVRTRTGDTWSDWEALEYHDEHGPDAGSAEAANARPGTEPMFVGEVDDVQVQASTDGTTLPDDLSLALVDPGSAKASETEAPADRPAADDPTASYEQDYAEQGAMTRLRRHQPARGELAAGRRPADDLLAGPVGRRREHPQQELAALRHHQRRLRAPHGQRQRLHRGPGAGASCAASTPTT